MQMNFTLLIFLALSFNAFSQNEPSKNLPPIKMLPKVGEVKLIYELPAKTDYKIYNSAGRLIQEGNAQFIEYTNYKKDTYFITFDDKTEKFTKK